MLMETLEYLGIAIICSVVLIILSKIILQSLIRRPADYYDAEELKQEELMLNAGGLSMATEHETTPEGEIIEETHLEPHLGDFTPAEPEDLFSETDEAVIDSIEETIEDVPHHIYEDDKEFGDDTEIQPDLFADIEEVLEEEIIEIEETDAAVTLDEPEEDQLIEQIKNTSQEMVSEISESEEIRPSSEESEQAESETETVDEPVAETVPDQKSETSQTAENEPEQEPETISEEEPEPEAASEEEPEPEPEPIEFSIKARTTRERPPIRKAEPEPEPEDTEEINASEETDLRDWTETYDEIRDSLEQAYSQTREDSGEPEEISAADTSSDERVDNISNDEAVAEDTRRDQSRKKGRKKKNNRNRRQKPSMNMNKKTLTEIALSKGIEIPEGATKRMILDLIYAEKRK